MLHPSLANSSTAYSRSKSNLKKSDPFLPVSDLPVLKCFAIPEYKDLEIISLNLNRFPHSVLAAEFLYRFIALNPVHIFIFQEVQDTKLLNSVFDSINKQLMSQEYSVLISDKVINRTNLVIAYRHNSITYISHKSILSNCYLKTPYILSPPFLFRFKYHFYNFSLLNIHSVPYQSHSAYLKRDKFFNLLKYYILSFDDLRFTIIGGDWNFRPPGLPNYFPDREFDLPHSYFKNYIDYFVTYYPVKYLVPAHYSYNQSFQHSINKSKVFVNWKSNFSDHYPVLYTFKFV